MGSDKPEWEKDPQKQAQFDELVEIERATARLRGLDPNQAEEIVRARFSAGAELVARTEHTDQIRAEIVAKKRRRRKVILLGAVGVAAVAAAAVPATRAVMAGLEEAAAFRQALSEAGASVVDAGFQQQADWLNLDESGVPFDMPGGTCSAVIGVGAGGVGVRSIRIERPSATLEGESGQIWCACADERVVVRPAPGAEGPIAARRWSSSADATGGPEVLRAATIGGFTVHVDPTDLACASAAFESWASLGDNGKAPPLDAEVGGVAGKLLAAGWEPAGTLPASHSFVVLRPEPTRCLLAVPRGEPGKLSLRASDGTRWITETKAAPAWCGYGKAGTMSLWRNEPGGGDYALLSIPANRVGGMAGVVELTQSLGLEPLEPVVDAADLTADAVAALHASTVPASSTVRAVGGILAKKPKHRVVAFTQLEAGAFSVDTKPEARLACSPKRAPGASVQAFVCVQAKPQGWRSGGQAGRQAAAAGPLPAWLKILAEVPDPEAVDVMAKLLRLARLMAARGSEPTTTDGVKETVWGATVSGRPKKTEVVAVGLTRTRPWVHPLTDGEPWTLDGPVRFVKVTPDGYVKLKARRSLGHNAASRRVVVWRR
ncbi:MAG: hypothetical protein JRI68_13540 [Deltaproteobacteria bacterium]|nr:hypothetical protein [Deltaproteobacteria bacterium]